MDWASLIVGREFTSFALFYFVFEGNFQVQAPGGLIFGGAYTWRGLFSEFYGTSATRVNYANLFELVLCSLVCSLLIRNKSFQIIIMLVLNVFKQSLLISSHLL